jgi:hypothetical protein
MDRMAESSITPAERRATTPWCWFGVRPLLLLAAGFVALSAVGVMSGILLSAATPGWDPQVPGDAATVLDVEHRPRATALDPGGVVDERVLARVTDDRGDTALLAAHRVADLAKIWVVIPVVAAFGFWWWRRTANPDGWLLPVLAGGGGLALSVVVKYLTYRPRPPEALAAIDAFGPSFPSGHVLRAVTVYGAAAFLLSRLERTRAQRAAVWAAAAIVSVAVGAARIYEASHWPSDVLVSLLLAAGWLALVLLATTRFAAVRGS